MKTEAIRLRFDSGLHIGRGAEELDKSATSYGSDALKSALFAVGLPYYPDWGSNHKAFFESFRISSAFPYCGENYFLPKPAGMTFQFEQVDDMAEAKLAKKIAWVSSDIFIQWSLNPSSKIKVGKQQLGEGSFLFKSENANKFLFNTAQQRVAVASDGGDSTPYYFDRIFFSEDSGLYLLIQFHNETIRPQVLHVLSLLGDAGIGTDRTVGNGQFVADSPQLFELPDNNIKGVQICLGLYLPQEDELNSIDMSNSYWSLIRRGGYMAASENDAFRSLRKNSIYFFGECSAFKTDVKLSGKYVDLQPEWNTPGMHPVLRCGMPLFINL